MKKFTAFILMIALLLTLAPAAFAYEYWDPSLASYEVTASKGRVYMYAKPSSSGNPVATYKKGVIVKVIDYNIDRTYCYAIGPDGKEGYINKSYLTEVLDISYDDENLEEYRVVIEGGAKLYLYLDPSSNGDARAYYKNGELLKMVDLNADKNFCFVIDKNNNTGYVRKEYLIKVYDYNDESYEKYRVTSTYSTGYLFMYRKPTSDYDAIATYYNDTVLKVIDYDADKNYCFCVGPDGNAGYVTKSGLTKETESGSLGVIFEVFATRSYCYMYAKPNNGSANLGRYNNGDQIEIIDWNADTNYAFVRGVKDNKYGYIQKSSLITGAKSPVKGYMMVQSSILSYVYLYEKASDGSKNLGRYNNGVQVGILDWNASELYALVYTSDKKIGYIKKNSLVSLF